MSGFYVLKNTRTGKYYSNDELFIESNKEYAKRLRKGQALALQRKFNRFTINPVVIIEPVG